MNEREEVRLRHMLDAGREALGFMEGRTSEDLVGDRMFFLALVKELEIIGEAAGQISEETRQSLPGIPWTMVVAMRNRLVHAYESISHALVWSALTVHLPELIAALEKAVPPILD
jgi:uncharacterized protein with HEPN domain